MRGEAQERMALVEVYEEPVTGFMELIRAQK